MSNQNTLPPSIDKIDTLLQKVYEKIGAPNTCEIEDKVQHELSKSIVLLQRIKRCLIRAQYKKHQVHVAQLESIIIGLESAIAVLLEKPYELHFSRRLRRDAEFAVREYENPLGGRIINAFKYVLYESSTPVKIFAGLAMSLPIALTIGLSSQIIPYQDMTRDYIVQPLVSQECTVIGPPVPNCEALATARANENLAILASVALAGALGGITSTLSRIREYRNDDYTDTVLPVCIGLIRPFVGGAFGILLFVLLSSKLLPLQVGDDSDDTLKKWYGFIAIAFVAGFSERLVKDMISQTEGRFLPGTTSPPQIKSEIKLNQDIVQGRLEPSQTQASPQTKIVVQE
ncbi:hypothetical protein IQ260_21645 [Leptolyngbya cf. ectocarpi LEGE 11479]|uniref:Uncharacterized protein n=1 Tax=Leptolyngbya cf. ectocarpi LEGE 11479 TaxID=1828722 RepID=A0A928ZXH5_LEPEC|nr:hypothetical protein [Leptolyngbya ectocarpi]MBE9069250.1 hypothetical protein [Leptolyngbya cf. ectocarpi LEGE 11479]